MIQLPVLSQRNLLWKYKKLGNSNVTIGDYGCVITCLTMISKMLDVSRVNDLFKEKEVYVEQNLVYWVKVPDALSNLVFKWRSWTYNNKEVLDWIKKGFPVIVQVDAAPIGSPRTDHYVVFIGDQKLIDPWDGKIKPTSTYPILRGYILYETRPQLTDGEKIAQIKAWVQDTSKPDSDVRYLIKDLLK